MAEKRKTRGSWITIGVGILICLSLPIWLTLTGEIDAGFWKQILLVLWEPLKSMPIMAVVIPVGIFMVILAIWQASKQPESPRCPTCSQVLPEEEKGLAAKPEDSLT